MKKAAILLFSVLALYAQSFTIYTENNPPWNYGYNGEVRGVVTQVVKAIQKDINNSDEIFVLPWNRAYRESLKKPNHILYSTARIKQREELFHWVGPVVVDKVYLYRHKNAPFTINSLEDAKRVRAIDAGPSTNAAHMILKEKGFTNLSVLSRDIASFEALQKGRVDLIALGAGALKYKALLEGIDPALFVNTGVLVYEYPLYIAFSKDVDTKIVKKWEQSFEKLQKEGIIEHIMKKELNITVKNAKN